MGLTLITAPPVNPLSLEEVKEHLRVDYTDEDDLISLYISAATNYADARDGFLGRCLVTQTWQLVLDGFPAAEIKIPMPPLQAVNAIRYDDPDGVEQTVNTADYYVDTSSEPGWVVPVGSWPTPLDGVNTVRIEFVAGYEATTASPPDYTANVPFNIKAALLLLIGNMYENREENVTGVTVTKLPFGVETLLRRHKIDVGFA